MRLISLYSIFLFITLNSLSSQTLFEETDLVDEFGDKTGSTLANTAIGTFSNSATNNSKLKVKILLEEAKPYTLEEYKQYLTEMYQSIGYNDRQIKSGLKYAHKSLDAMNNTKGNIEFRLYEYEDNLASLTGTDYGQISIKLSDESKIKAKLGKASFMGKFLTLTGYKERTKGITGVENMIKYNTYFWEQTEIYNAIFNSTQPVEVVLIFDNSTYKFIIE